MTNMLTQGRSTSSKVYLYIVCPGEVTAGFSGVVLFKQQKPEGDFLLKCQGYEHFSEYRYQVG